MKFYGVFFIFLFVNVQSYIIPQEAPANSGCARIHHEFITKQRTNFSYIDVKDCYESFPFDKDVASKVFIFIHAHKNSICIISKYIL